MQVKDFLATGRFIELLDRNPVRVKGFQDSVTQPLNCPHYRSKLFRSGVQHISAGRFRDHQQMPIRPRHDIHERKRIIVFIDPRGGDFSSQNFGKDVVRIIGCHWGCLRCGLPIGCAPWAGPGQAPRWHSGISALKCHPPATIILDPDQTPPLKALAGQSKTTFESKAARTDFLWPFVMQQEAP